MTVTEFAPLAALFGGSLVGLASVLLMLFFGRIAGVSDIAVRMLPPYFNTAFAGRIAFIAGLVAAPTIYSLATGSLPAITIAVSPALLAAAGLLAGFGAVWGNGCTSGHGVCGMSRLSLRSLFAVIAFMSTAALTVFVVRHLI
jgi:hypothetical protein